MENGLTLCPVCGKYHTGACHDLKDTQHTHSSRRHTREHGSGDCCSAHSHAHSHTHSHEHNHSHSHSHGHEHAHGESHEGFLHTYSRELASLCMLIAGVLLSHFGVFLSIAVSANLPFWLPAFLFYLAAIVPVAWNIVGETLRLWVRGDIMNEFSLMVLAAAGAFAIGEFPEAVAVLLFYSFGEKLQDSASDNVKRRIRDLVGRMPQTVTVETAKGDTAVVKPEEVEAGTVMVARPGERLAVDGVLCPEKSSAAGAYAVDFDTSAITGESVPRSFEAGQELSAGMIPIDREVRVRATRPFSDSTLSRMMQLIEKASESRTPTESMLRRITRWFTPAVVSLALAVFLVPWIVSLATGSPFDAMTWFKRSLVFLVCSCPCALVVSIPLSYFASLGNAARKGLLFKGAAYIDTMRDIDTVVFDKTGTVTTGRFRVTGIHPAQGVAADELLAVAAGMETHSFHPLARAVTEEARRLNVQPAGISDVKSVPHGMTGMLDSRPVLAGSRKLMRSQGVEGIPAEGTAQSEICIAIDGRFAGSVAMADQEKPEAAQAIESLHSLGIRDVRILSGDREETVAAVSRTVGADSHMSELLPEGKYSEIERLKAQGRKVAFVGDGINDAPSIAAAQIGVAMGTLGTDMAMESADVVVAGDDLTKVAEGVRLSRKVRRVVMENVTFAFGIKGAVMILAAFGIATLWAGVFADTGVTLLTVIWTLARLKAFGKGE